MTSPLAGLGVSSPVLAAPMAGGPSTPALVVATAQAGGLGFLAGGYQSPRLLADQITATRAHTAAFGVNLFAPNPVPITRVAFRRYAHAVQAEADAYGLDLTSAELVEDDDAWQDKIDLLLADPVPVVSFTFGLPPVAVIRALRAAGTVVAQTVTSAVEAQQADDLGADLLIVQSTAAGGHSGTFTPGRPVTPLALAELVAQVRETVAVPLVATGGLATSTDIAAVLNVGAAAAAVGTVLLRTHESGTSRTHRDALADPNREGTVVTRAYTGRPARTLRNRFTDRYTTTAPLGYPALHHLTSPLRAAAAAAGDPEIVHLWAGSGYRHATAEPAAEVLHRLTQRL